jgi:hypothetical protein
MVLLQVLAAVPFAELLRLFTAETQRAQRAAEN